MQSYGVVHSGEELCQSPALISASEPCSRLDEVPEGMTLSDFQCFKAWIVHKFPGLLFHYLKMVGEKTKTGQKTSNSNNKKPKKE